MGTYWFLNVVTCYYNMYLIANYMFKNQYVGIYFYKKKNLYIYIWVF